MDSGLTRRQVLQAGIAAGAVALSSDPLVQMASAAVTPPLGKLSDIEHVIILIQENRSFDHYFGTYNGRRGFRQPVRESRLRTGRLPGRRLRREAAAVPPGNEQRGPVLPGHHPQLGAAAPQLGQRRDGRLRAHAPGSRRHRRRASTTMGYYEKADIPFYHALANAFTICDHYHCSVLGPTDPNRLYSMTGTIDPNGDNGGPLVETLEKGDPRASGQVHVGDDARGARCAAGISWKVYDGHDPRLRGQPAGVLQKLQDQPDAGEAKAFENSYPKYFKHDLNHGRTAAGLLDQRLGGRNRAPGQLERQDRRVRRGRPAQAGHGPQIDVGKNGDLHHLG